MSPPSFAQRCELEKLENVGLYFPFDLDRHIEWQERDAVDLLQPTSLGVSPKPLPRKDDDFPPMHSASCTSPPVSSALPQGLTLYLAFYLFSRSPYEQTSPRRPNRRLAVI